MRRIHKYVDGQFIEEIVLDDQEDLSLLNDSDKLNEFLTKVSSATSLADVKKAAADILQKEGKQ